MGVACPPLRTGLRALGAPYIYLPSQLLAVVRRRHSQGWFGGLRFQPFHLLRRFERSLESHQRWKVRFPGNCSWSGGCSDVLGCRSFGTPGTAMSPLASQGRRGGELDGAHLVLKWVGWSVGGWQESISCSKPYPT